MTFILSSLLISDYITPVMYADSTGYSIWRDLVNALKATWNYRIYSKLHEINQIEEFTSKHLAGTMSIGLYGTGSAFVSATVNPMVSIDGRGNIGLQYTGSLGVSGIPFVPPTPSVVTGYNLMFTSAENIYDLDGLGMSIGGSFGVPAVAPPFGGSLGIEGVTNLRDYWGYNFFGGVGIGNLPELHFELTNTVTACSINIYDIQRKFYSLFILD